ncbi:MAG: OmpW family protein [Alphaproteobacteria bacterium]|jgi:outer membrane protein|nr:OmpW family protein [Alphaproteobacteria bacterium]
MTNRLLAAATLAGALTASVAAIAVPQAAHAEQGPWLVRGRLLAVLPDEGASVTVLGGDLEIEDQFVPELDITYFFDKHWAAELILAVTPHEITHKPTGLDIGEVWLLPPTLTVQYHFQPDDPDFRPYIGAGVNYTMFFGHDDADPAILDADFDSSVGFALQAGFDIPIDEHWSINVDVKKVWINTDVRLDTTLGPVDADVDINPLIVGVGVAYRW